MRNFFQIWSHRRYDLYGYWRSIGGGEVPEDVGGLYCDAVARQAGSWWRTSQVELQDSKTRERVERIANTCGLISEFLSSVSHFREAAQMQRHSLQVG